MSFRMWLVLLVLGVVGCRSTKPNPDYCPDCPANTDGDVDADTGCKSNPECTASSASRCENKVCKACIESADCDHITGKNVCHDGTCVECTLETEAATCGSKACNLTINQCTDTDRDSLTTCQPCETDSECKDETGIERSCVVVQFSDPMLAEPMFEDVGQYCLVKKEGTCPRQTIGTVTTESVDGDSGMFCFPQQGLTTCEAILNFTTNQDECTSDAECGKPGYNDALCRDNGAGAKCTYRCGGDNNECLTGFTCFNGTGGLYCCTQSGVCAEP